MPFSEIPFLMRAAGFFPSERQITEMLNEVTFNDDVDYNGDDDDDDPDKQIAEGRGEINLEQLVRLFINHRFNLVYEL